MLSDEMLTAFRWHWKTYFQYHIVTYILWHLCIKPESSSSARAFKLIDHAFEIFNYDYNSGSKRAVILKLRAKALCLRDSADQQGTVPLDDTAGLQDLSGELGDYRDLSNWGTNVHNDFVGWDHFLEDFNMQT